MKRDVLYVDDEPDNLIVFEASFESAFNITTVSSAARALERLAQRPYPVVVSDQRMPGMTGTELFEVMRRQHPHTKRVMLTGYADTKAMLEAINQGQVYHFLKKPWERHVVMSVLMRAIEAYDLSLANMALTDRLVASDRCAALGRSAARIAHEMGNQLCILPLLELIEERYADQEDLVRTADLARQTHDRLAALVDEVKSFVRFEQSTVDMQPLSLAALVHELLAFLRYDNSLPHERIASRVAVDAQVRGNRVKLQQVLINLLKNAADAIRHVANGQIVLTVDANPLEATIRVEDNGCGMPPEIAARIWEPFFTTKGEEGNGLGLDIVKQIVEGHLGRIDCHTSPGRGTAFVIRLPLDVSAREQPAAAVGYAPTTTDANYTAQLVGQP